jgi:hypothetical protein
MWHHWWSQALIMPTSTTLACFESHDCVNQILVLGQWIGCQAWCQQGHCKLCGSVLDRASALFGGVM